METQELWKESGRRVRDRFAEAMRQYLPTGERIGRNLKAIDTKLMSRVRKKDVDNGDLVKLANSYRGLADLELDLLNLKPSQKHEISGADGEPIEITITWPENGNGKS